MALLTPPHSGKEPLAHSFGANDDKTVFSPLFSPIVPSGRLSPSDALLMSSSRRRLSHSAPITPATISRAVKRGWSEDNDNAFGLLPTHEKLAKRARVDSPIAHDEPLFPVSTPQPKRSQPAAPASSASPPSSQDIELVDWFYENFSDKFLTSVRDPVKNTWLVLANAPALPTPVASLSRTRTMSQKRVRKTSVLPEDADYERPGSKGTPTRAKASGSHQRQRSLQLPPLASIKGEVKTTRSPANKALVSKDYNDWPDFSPPPSTLDSARHTAESMPQMSGRKDLSTDPLRHELHPVELIAAHHAGVDCARYLVTKRSVFVGFTKYLLHKHNKRQLTAEEIKKGLKSWNKTAAQNCSSIDVNKTSALFADFWQKCNWFDEKHFKDIINGVRIAYFPLFDKDGRRTGEAV